MSKRWLYKVHEIKPNMWGVVKPEDLQSELDRLGSQGWELVSLTMPAMTFTQPVAVFKKEH